MQLKEKSIFGSLGGGWSTRRHLFNDRISLFSSLVIGVPMAFFAGTVPSKPLSRPTASSTPFASMSSRAYGTRDRGSASSSKFFIVMMSNIMTKSSDILTESHDVLPAIAKYLQVPLVDSFSSQTVHLAHCEDAHSCMCHILFSRVGCGRSNKF